MSRQRGVAQVCGGEDRRANGGFIQEGGAREVGVEGGGGGRILSRIVSPAAPPPFIRKDAGRRR